MSGSSGEIDGYKYALVEQTGLIAVRRPTAPFECCRVPTISILPSINLSRWIRGLPTTNPVLPKLYRACSRVV